MSEGPGYLLAAIAIMGVITFALRALPFVLFRRGTSSPLLFFLGGVMPAGVMVILVIYSVSALDYRHFPYGLPGLISIALVVAVHHWRRNALLSIVAGTACNMLLLHLLGA